MSLGCLNCQVGFTDQANLTAPDWYSDRNARIVELINCASIPSGNNIGCPNCGQIVVHLFDLPPLNCDRFSGETIEHEADSRRLSVQLARVFHLMRDSQWRDLAEIETHTGDPQASISSRLRDLRKPRFGCYVMEARRIGKKSDGHWVYCVWGRPVLR